MNIPSDPTTVLCAHVIETLPDSLAKRKKLLLAIKSLMTAQHPAMKHVCSSLTSIEALEELQPALSEEFEKLLGGK